VGLAVNKRRFARPRKTKPASEGCRPFERSSPIWVSFASAPTRAAKAVERSRIEHAGPSDFLVLLTFHIPKPASWGRPRRRTGRGHCPPLPETLPAPELGNFASKQRRDAQPKIVSQATPRIPPGASKPATRVDRAPSRVAAARSGVDATPPDFRRKSAALPWSAVTRSIFPDTEPDARSDGRLGGVRPLTAKLRKRARRRPTPRKRPTPGDLGRRQAWFRPAARLRRGDLSCCPPELGDPLRGMADFGIEKEGGGEGSEFRRRARRQVKAPVRALNPSQMGSWVPTK